MLACYVLLYTKTRSVLHRPCKAPKSHTIRPLPPSLRTSAPFASLRDPFPAPGWGRWNAGHFKDHLNATPLRISPLECAVTSKHRVLPGFGRSCPPATPLECAVTQIGAVSPLECALTKKVGGGEGVAWFLTPQLRRFLHAFVWNCQRPTVNSKPAGKPINRLSGGQFAQSAGSFFRGGRLRGHANRFFQFDPRLLHIVQLLVGHS